MDDRQWIVEVLVPATQTVLYRSREMHTAEAWREGAKLQRRGYDVRFVEVASDAARVVGR